jgi:hypothetical protein
VGEPNIPTRYSSVVLYHNLEVLELADSDCVEGYVQEDKSPFEEGVNGVSYAIVSTARSLTRARTCLQQHGEPCVE